MKTKNDDKTALARETIDYIKTSVNGETYIKFSQDKRFMKELALRVLSKRDWLWNDPELTDISHVVELVTSTVAAYKEGLKRLQ